MKFYYLIDTLKDSVVCVWQAQSLDEAIRNVRIVLKNMDSVLFDDLRFVEGKSVNETLECVIDIDEFEEVKNECKN